MSSFDITTAREFLEKLHQEHHDFARSGFLSARHALNAIITAYHLHEWVWGECRDQHPELIEKWNLRPTKDAREFQKYLADPTRCPHIEDARKVTNGTKHFGLGKITTGTHHGAFSRDFSNDFDVSYLWIERNGEQERAEDFVGGLVAFWDTFFKENGL